MTSKVIYKGGLRTEATHLASGQKIITDAPIDNRGLGKAFSPTDTVATALASCMITIMGIRAMDEGFNIDGAMAEVQKTMGADPRRISKIEIEITMPPNSYTDEQKTIIKEATQNCPVCKSLHPTLERVIKIVWQ